MSEGRDEFVMVGWIAIVGLFASGFMLAEAIESLRAGVPAAGEFFIAILLALVARSDAKDRMNSGTYRRDFLFWKRTH